MDGRVEPGHDEKGGADLFTNGVAAGEATATARGLPWRAAFVATGISIMFGFVPLATRGLYADGLSPFSLLFWRYWLALGVILLAARLAGLELRAAARRGAWQISLIGASLGALQTLCYFESLRWLDTGIATLLFYTYPAVTLGLERFLFRQPVAPLAVLCVAAIFAGAALIAVPGLHAGTIDPRGLVWAIPGPIIYAFYLSANARLMARHPPLIGAAFLYIGFGFSYLVAVLVLGLAAPSSGTGWLSLLFLAFGVGAVAAVSQSYSVPRLGPGSYAMIANLELVTVVIVGALVLGEALTLNRAAGGALILCGILLHGLARRPARRQAAGFERLRST